MSAGNATAAASVRSLDNREQALELRKLGLSYTRIAERLGCNRTTAYRYVKDALDALKSECDEHAEDVRRIELERLDSAQAALVKRVLSGDVRAIEVTLKIQERRARMLGIDAPTRAEHELIFRQHPDFLRFVRILRDEAEGTEHLAFVLRVIDRFEGRAVDAPALPASVEP